MKRLAIAFLGLAWVGWALPVVPLLTSPGAPIYLRFVVELVAGAQSEVLVALSDARLYLGEGATRELFTALATAAGRGVPVKVLLEQGERELDSTQREARRFLEEHGVQVREDDQGVTLHAKFLVVDRRWVVVGSTPWTKSALERSVQVDLALESADLGAAFAAFFERVWEGRLRGRPKLPPAPWPEPAVVPLLDLPEGFLHAHLIPELIARAHYTVDVLLYRLAYYPQYPDSPSNRIVEALRAALARGVQVRILLDDGSAFQDVALGNRMAAAFLAAFGAQVRLDQAGVTLHAKCLIVDGRDVVVTSANWSYYSLAKNVEAGVALLGVPELGRPLVQIFEALWAKGRPLR